MKAFGHNFVCVDQSFARGKAETNIWIWKEPKPQMKSWKN